MARQKQGQELLPDLAWFIFRIIEFQRNWSVPVEKHPFQKHPFQKHPFLSWAPFPKGFEHQRFNSARCHLAESIAADRASSQQRQQRKQCHSPRANQGNVQVSPAKLPEVPTYQAARVYLTGLLGFIAIPNGCRSSSAIMDRSEIYTRASQGHGCGTMTLLQTWTELHTMPHLVGLPASDALLALELATTCHVTEKPCAPEISPRL